MMISKGTDTLGVSLSSPLTFVVEGCHLIFLCEMAALRDQLAASAAAASSSSSTRVEEAAFVYPHLLDEEADAASKRGHATRLLANIEFEPTAVSDLNGRLPFFYGMPLDSSREKEVIHALPRTQELFLRTFAPRNLTLLPPWLNLFDANYKSMPRWRSGDLIQEWTGSGYASVRDFLLTHPRKGEWTDLPSLLPMLTNDTDDSPLQRGKMTRQQCREFLNLLFMPGPRRVGVPLPVGLVLFEGKQGSSVGQITSLAGYARIPPFSTTWHPDVAAYFTETALSPARLNKDHNVLFCHAIMSDGILGVVARRQHLSDEMEIIVQPLVHLHVLPTSHIVAMEKHEFKGVPTTKLRKALYRIRFTHLFLGDKCPCEATTEDTPEEEETPDAKRQRLAARLHVALGGGK